MSKFEHDHPRLTRELLLRLDILKDFALEIIWKISGSQETQLPENIGNWVNDAYSMILSECNKRPGSAQEILVAVQIAQRTGHAFDEPEQLVSVNALRLSLGYNISYFRNNDQPVDYRKIQGVLRLHARQYLPRAERTLFINERVTRKFLELLGSKILKDFPFQGDK